MIQIFYHIYCIENTDKIVRDQCVKIIFSGLYERVDNIYCFLLGEDYKREEIKILLGQMGHKFLIADESIEILLYERFTLLGMRKFVSAEDKILYIHTKGITRIGTPHENSIKEWREYMEYWLIAKCHECIKKLDEVDLVGVILSHYPKTHFSGNFWWSTGKYLLTLPETIGDHYLDCEMYILQRNDPTYHIIHNTGGVHNRPCYDTEGQWTFSKYIIP